MSEGNSIYSFSNGLQDAIVARYAPSWPRWEWICFSFIADLLFFLGTKAVPIVATMELKV
jgi:hypothetical protein